jgi:hypothetical protein
MRSGNFDAVLTGNCQSVVNATLDVQRYLPSSVYAANYGNFEDPEEIDLYDEMLRETDPAKQRALIRDLEKYVLYRGARDLFAVVLPDGSAPVVCEGLEDQPEPLPQSGLSDNLARQMIRLKKGCPGSGEEWQPMVLSRQ